MEHLRLFVSSCFYWVGGGALPLTILGPRFPPQVSPLMRKFLESFIWFAFVLSGEAKWLSPCLLCKVGRGCFSIQVSLSTFSNLVNCSLSSRYTRKHNEAFLCLQTLLLTLVNNEVYSILKTVPEVRNHTKLLFKVP